MCFIVSYTDQKKAREREFAHLTVLSGMQTEMRPFLCAQCLGWVCVGFLACSVSHVLPGARSVCDSEARRAQLAQLSLLPSEPHMCAVGTAPLLHQPGNRHLDFAKMMG